MPFEDILGRIVRLVVLRLGDPGAFLAPHESSEPGTPTILLPRAEVPGGSKAGDVLEVFVYLDSEDRPIATVGEPKLTIGEVAFLTVTDVAPFGAFVDWGLMKELLVPLREQVREMKRGERHPVGLYVDDTGRLAGTTRVTEMLKDRPDVELDEWVSGEAWRSEPGIGVFVIVEQRFVGLVPAVEPHGLTRGQAATFRVSNILPDGKIELSLRGAAHEELEKDAASILEKLSRAPATGPSRIDAGDRSTPDHIRAVFGVSKKVFKRAAGRLLKLGSVTIDAEGFLRPRTAAGGTPKRPVGR
jgi:predicted RNA-binding protein (virulence factor B family)